MTKVRTTMTRRRYPVGIQTFSEIRTKGYVYIDKTEHVYNLANGDSKYNFLSRPRRFGKSLLTSTFHSYFSGQKELFKGLAIEKLEKEWTAYPVLHFDMSLGKHLGKDELTDFLLYLIQQNEKPFGINNDSTSPNIRLANLIRTAYEQTGQQVVVLIDEYDAPLLDVMHKEEYLDELRFMMRNFYSPLKGCDMFLRFVFLTGITKFSQLSIFSELNNIVNISMEGEYASICGITQDELLTQMDEDVKGLALSLNLTYDQTVLKLKENYDGYHFCWPAPDIYNPFSLLNAFARSRIDSYWFESGTPSYLIEMMKKHKMLPSKIGSTRAKSSSFDAPTHQASSLLPLLYQSGYLTIKDYNPEIGTYTLDLPNKEIRIGLFECLLPNYVEEETDNAKVLAGDLSILIKQGHMDSAMQLLQKYLSTVPYCDNTLYEGHYQQMLYVIFTLLTGYQITVEQRTQKGRTDMTIETADRIYIIEIKFNHSAQDALAQINANNYAAAFALKGKSITKVGIGFNVEQNRNMTDWVIETL